jgi:hypothetical protein
MRSLQFTEAFQIRRKHLGDDHSLTHKVQSLIKRNRAARAAGLPGDLSAVAGAEVR